MFKTRWQSSADKLKSTKYLALMAAMIALKTVNSSWYIPVGENLRIGIGFLFVALEASIIGPCAGMVSGAITDIVSFMLFPSGTFFPGYTLTAMAGEFVYAFFLYERKITIPRLIGAKLITSYVVNVLMGSLWSAILYGKAYYYYFVKSLIKNTTFLPFQVLLLIVLFKALTPLLKKKKLIVDEDR